MKAQFLGTRFHYDNSFLYKPIKLPNLELVQIGEICLEAGFQIPEHNQVCSEISYIFAGRGVFEHNGIKTNVSAGDIIISPSCGKHSILAAENEEIYFAYTGFSVTSTTLFPESITELLGNGEHIICKDTVGIYNYFKKCMDEFYLNGEINTLLIESYLLQIILLTERAFKNTQTNSDYRKSSDSPGRLVYLIIKYIERNIEKPITVSGIADTLGYSTYYISHKFKNKMNITIQEYISNRKIEKAKEMMKLEGFSLTKISDKLGYTSLQSFSRSFKNATGLSPSQYIQSIN